MARSAEIEQAVAVWKLTTEGPCIVRWIPPESFLASQAEIGRADPELAAEPDFVKDNPGFFRPRVRLPPLRRPEVAQLDRFGDPGEPPVDVAVTLLRRARSTPLELEAAYAVLGARGPVPDPVRLEAAYLFAANGVRGAALEVLDGRPRPHADPPDPGPPLVSGTAGTIAREAELWLGYRAIQPAGRPPLPAASPPTAPPSPSAHAPAPAEPSDLALLRLAWLGQSVGPTVEEALAILDAARGTSRARQAVERVISSRESGPLPEPLLARCADMLAEMGDPRAAMVLLAPPPSPPRSPAPPGIDVDTPLREGDAAARADAAERVIAADADRLGVPERRARFRAVARAAAMTVDALRPPHEGEPRAPHDGLHDAGRALEAVGEGGRAAEVYALGGDHAEAARAGVPPKGLPPEGAGASISVMTAVDALDRRGLRLAALEAARAHLAGHPDPDLAAFARGILARLLRGPVVTLAVDGRPQRVALGDVVTIGRTGAALPIASPLASRLHLRLYRRGGVAMVEDPGSHNGTFLAGARLSAPIPIGAGLDLSIGGEIPCAIREEDGAVAVDLAGERTLAPLGPLALGGVLVARVPHGDDAVVTLTVRPGSLAWLGDEAVVTAIELSRGDRVRTAGGAPREIAVLG